MGYLDVIKPDGVIGIIDADLMAGGTRHPNLALMKISGYCKELGCYVKLLESYDEIPNYDAVFISKVFTFTPVPEKLFEHDNIYVGGTGFFEDGGEFLPNAIEHHMPDYGLYSDWVQKKICGGGRTRSWYADYLDYSIGFTTRGCFRKCSFCVNKKYDRAFRHSPVTEFVDPSRPYIYLWDDNFFAFPQWESILDELEATGKPFQFRQGLDVRLLDSRKARRLANARYIGDYIFAFDHVEDRPIIEQKLTIWRNATAHGTRLYVLCAFDSQDEKDIESTFTRIAVLMKYGCLPYIMRYESYKKSKWRSLYVNIARWCNQPQFFKKKSFREFCIANQEYHKNKKTLCSAMRAMTEFEKEFPVIAARFFDLKYEEENMLHRLGRPYYIHPTAEVDQEQRTAWNRFSSGLMTDGEAIMAYYQKQLDSVWAERWGSDNAKESIPKLFLLIKEASLDEAFSALVNSNQKTPPEFVSPENIPQFSSLDVVFKVPTTIMSLDEAMTYEVLGIYLCPEERKVEGAHKKFGENHGKTAVLMDLAYLTSNGSRTAFMASQFGRLFMELDEPSQRAIAARLVLRIPIISRMLLDAKDKEIVLSDYLTTLSESTQKRRRPNVSALFDLIYEQADERDAAIRAAILRIRRQ